MAHFATEAELEAFLGELNLTYGQYATALWSNGVTTQRQLANADKEDLLAAGVTSAIHAKDIKATAGTQGYKASRTVGKAFLKITEKQMTDSGMSIADANAILAEVEPVQGAWEPDDLKHILKQLTDVMQDNMRLVRLVLRGQLRPVSSSASTKRLEHYRLSAIEYYYGSNADMSKIRCMVTGEEVDFKEITAGHIYRQAWPTGLLKVMGCRLHEPCNIVLMLKQLEKRFDNWDWTIVPEGPDAFRVRVLNPQLLDPKGREQYITGHAGKGTSWRAVDNTLLHLPTIAHPARRLCCLHATLAVQEADMKGWFDEKHEAPKMSEASWQSPTFDHSLMKKYLIDDAANLFDAETASGSGD